MTTAIMKKELKEEKAKIDLMSVEKLLWYTKTVLRKLSRIIEKENSLFSKNKYEKIAEENGLEKARLSDLLAYSSSLMAKSPGINKFAGEIKAFREDLSKVIEMTEQNKVHILKVTKLQKMLYEMQADGLIEENNQTFGYDSQYKYTSSQDPVKYMQAVNTNKYT
jgi:hypothetical protein